MSGWQKWLWGGVGWSLGGPIGAILAYSLASFSAKNNTIKKEGNFQNETKPGDFGIALLILFAAVMKADGFQNKSELEYIKTFFIKQFGRKYTQERMQLFKGILKQNISISQVCNQIKSNMDHATRLQLLHVLFELSKVDGLIHQSEIAIIKKIAIYLNISDKDYESIKAMFFKSANNAYKILEIDSSATSNEIKKAYRKMAIKYHPDKVQHLGEDFQKMAEEKFKILNEAYHRIKNERGL